MNLHGWITEKNPRFTNVVIGGAGFCSKDQASQRIARMRGELGKEGLIHGGLRRLFGETGRSPDSNAAAIGSE